MADLKEARVPDIGGHGDVPIIELLVKVGDTVAVDQGLVTLESDKATMEVPSPFAGVIKELKVKLGDTVSEGALVAVIEVVATTAAAPAPAVEAREAGRSTEGDQHGLRNGCEGGAGCGHARAAAAPTARTCARCRRRADGRRPAAGALRCRRRAAGQGAVRQSGGAPVRPRAGRGPDAGHRQRARRPHRQGRCAEFRQVGVGRWRCAACRQAIPDRWRWRA